MKTKTRPIIFSGPMVRAILDGRKTQTRRVVKHAPHADCPYHTIDGQVARCPYGRVGGRLSVKESLRVISFGAGTAEIIYDADGTRRICDATGMPDTCKHVNARYCPLSARRIALEITDVRVQRVQEISEDDARAEGVSDCPYLLDESENELVGMDGLGGSLIVPRFCKLWNSINTKPGHGWDANPWVWAITFKKVEACDA